MLRFLEIVKAYFTELTKRRYWVYNKSEGIIADFENYLCVQRIELRTPKATAHNTEIE